MDPLDAVVGAEPVAVPQVGEPKVSNDRRPRTIVPLDDIANTKVPENPYATGPKDEYKKPEAAPPAATEIVEEWQLTDEKGNSIGPPTRLVAKSEAEMRKLLVECNKSAARKLAEYRTKYRESIIKEDPVEVPAAHELSSAEKLEIRRLLDKPDTQEEGFDRLFKARVGLSPEDFRKDTAEEAALVAKQQAYSEGVQFINETPDFPVGKEGMEAFKAFWAEKQEALRKEKNDPNFVIAAKKQNMTLIFEEAVEAGRMTRREGSFQETVPETVPEANPPVSAQPSGENAPVDPAVRTRPRGTRHESMGPTHSSVNPGAVQNQDDALFLKQVAEMGKDELKLRIRRDVKFRQRLDSIKL
jgi:hypothetical protein